MDYEGDLRPSGDLDLVLIKATGERIEHAQAPVIKAPLLARLKNARRVLPVRAKLWVARRMHITTIVGELRLRHYDASRGVWIDYGVVGMRGVTDAGVAFLNDDWENDAQNITTMNFHAFGTGIAAEMNSDTLLGTEVETRETGTKSQPAANQLETVATHTFGATFVIAEHGIFSVITFNTITLWDRTLFGATIGVDSGDQIQATYTCTLNAGG